MNEETLDKIGRDLVAAIEAALAADTRVQACLEQARLAGLGFRVTLNRGPRPAVALQPGRSATAEGGTPATAGARAAKPAPVVYSVTESDRRFLRSLRIGVDPD